jgi:hypothetical protein
MIGTQTIRSSLERSIGVAIGFERTDGASGHGEGISPVVVNEPFAMHHGRAHTGLRPRDIMVVGG